MWYHLPQQQQLGAQIGKRGGQPPASSAGAKEAHAEGEEGKPTARDASGAKQEGYSEDGGGKGESARPPA